MLHLATDATVVPVRAGETDDAAPTEMASDYLLAGTIGMANTLPGQGDILVASSYRSDLPNDFFCAALGGLPNARFVVSYIGPSPYYHLYFRRYSADPGAPGFLEGNRLIDYYTREVRWAGTVVATEMLGSPPYYKTQAAAWLTWGYNPSYPAHPNPENRTVNLARIREDGTFVKYIDIFDGAGAAGAVGQTSGPSPELRVLIAYVGPPFRDSDTDRNPCGSALFARIFNPVGTLVASATIVSASLPSCFAAPSVAWNSYASRFEVIYQSHLYPPESRWHANYVLPDGTKESVARDVALCSIMKSGVSPDAGILTGGDCHRSTIGYDGSPRNGTHTLAWAYYGGLNWLSQDRVIVRSYHALPDGGATSSWVSKMPWSGDRSYRFPRQISIAEYDDAKFDDDSATVFDPDPIGSRPCSGGGLRGSCYQTEAMAVYGNNTLAAILYADLSPEPDPLFLSIVN